jgi:hypothetical protein
VCVRLHALSGWLEQGGEARCRGSERHPMNSRQRQPDYSVHLIVIGVVALIITLVLLP